MLLLCTVLMLLAAPVFADQVADDLSGYTLGLDATVKIENKTLLKTPDSLMVNITANNPSSTSMPVYLIRQKGDSWEMVRLLGLLQPNAPNHIDLEISVQFNKELVKKTRYSIVGRSDEGTLYGKDFVIEEDWNKYENDIANSLSSAIFIFVPVFGSLLVVIMLIMAHAAYTSKSKGIFAGEYTVRSLLFPVVEGRPFEEKLADIMISPFAMIFELVCIALLVLVMLDGVTQLWGPVQGIKLMMLAFLGAISVPFIYFAGAWYFEKREEGKPLRFFAGMFVWGMFAAFLSLLVSSGLITELGNVGILPYALVATMMISPIVEEILKGIGVLFISGHHEYNDTLTGLLLGFTCGAGFAFVENWFYFAAKSNPFEIGITGWGVLILYRSFFNTLAHGCFTAAISTTIGYLRSSDMLKKFARLAFAPGVFLAVTIHVMFNLSALADSFVFASKETPFFVFNPALIILLAAMFFLVLVLAVIDEKKRKMRHVDIASFQEIGGKPAVK